MARFLVFIFVLLGVYFYLFTRLATGQVSAILLFLPFLLILSFPYKKFGSWHVRLIYFSLGIISFLTVYTLIADVIASLSNNIFPPQDIILVSILSVIIGTFIARGPKIKHVPIKIKNLPKGLEGFRIVQISDLHVGANIRKSYVEKVVEKTNEASADLIVLTGDIGDGPVEKYREDIAPMANLRSTLGVFYVPGNHEYYWGINEWLNVMNNLKAIVLLNRGKKVHFKDVSILVGGVSDPAGMKPEPKMVKESVSDVDFSILLSHRPGLYDEASLLGYDLQLSGHTHGGQFFPWTLIVPLVHKINKGLHQVRSMWIYVSTGTGSWGPLLRLGTVPELTILELKQDPSGLKLEA